MEPAEKKAVVEAFDIHGVCNVTCIWGVQRRFHIERKDLQNLRFCVKISFDKPGRLDLVGQYKQIPIDDIYTDDVYDNYHKNINAGIQSF